MKFARYYRFTVWKNGHQIAQDLGLVPDANSNSQEGKWYYTFDTGKDSIAFQHFLCKDADPRNWVAHSVSTWRNDPRLF